MSCHPEKNPRLGTYNPKTDIVAPDVRVGPVASRRTAVVCIVEPRTTPQEAGQILRTILILIYPRTSICRRSNVIFMPLIFTPLPYVPVHIVQAEAIGWKFSYFCTSLPIFSFWRVFDCLITHLGFDGFCSSTAKNVLPNPPCPIILMAL
jgi:hypothetical protein